MTDTTNSQNKWSGRFNEPVAEIVKRYTASVNFDKRLAEYDIQASLAHARMLCNAKIISIDDFNAIEKGLKQIAQEIRQGEFSWSIDLEDVHLNIEKRLTTLIGDAGKRLHTARSRNDQVATDIRLLIRDAIDDIQVLIQSLQYTLIDVAERNVATIMPGFTHLQIAQPVSFGHYLLAYYEMLKRDYKRFSGCRERLNELPLGAAALAGTSYPINREQTAAELKFASVCANSIDAVSDRDFAIEFCSCCALLMVHLSRFCEDFILWVNPRFNFISLSDSFCTGSSIMPQKKNPDVLELARGKTGRVVGHLVALLTLMKSQALTYNKDNQEDKEPLFDTIDTVRDTLSIFVEMVKSIQANPDKMRSAAAEGFSTATDLADYLVKRGLPFRDAHEVVAQTVRYCENHQRNLSDLTMSELHQFSNLINEDVFSVLSVEGSVASRNHIGATAPAQVSEAIKRARAELQGRMKDEG